MNDQEKKERIVDIYQQWADGGKLQRKGVNEIWEDSSRSSFSPSFFSEVDDWRIKPALKVIDMTPMIGLGLDCDFLDSDSNYHRGPLALIRELVKHTKFVDFNGLHWESCQPRMSTEAQPFINFWAGGDTCPVPEGFRVTLHFRSGIVTKEPTSYQGADWTHTNECGDIIGIAFLGIKEGYTLEQES